MEKLGYDPDDASPDPDTLTGVGNLACGAVLWLFTGSDTFGDSVTFPAGSSNIEPGFTPSPAINLRWSTFTDAANKRKFPDATAAFTSKRRSHWQGD
jgi:hypothetical protein